ncbi:D-alanyl-D-alanine carboxypeptidase [Catalinimonas alkaloidigena]|uniref:D-alanyl-D-alanine carboxypeptidase n=1 Tax=Catalinimonas alkaloidigena TaxID=1075417 RepID=A0A1G9SBG2_9BACT|nr:serine hydrolase [Catalinimonas alkaloidigena]SDM32826.1 D-alanyl-D-alanine carboxypeptidase [Catalinimonas alkaloidigena]
MKHRFTRLLAWLYACLMLASGAHSQTLTPALQSRLQAVLDSFQHHYVGGMAVALQTSDGTRWHGETGYAARNVDAQNNLLPGGTPFTVDTLSHLYSITKTFTATLILELAEEGKFSLDDSAGTYLDLRAINDQLSGAVTLRQLLAHRSGFSDYVAETNFQVAIAAQPSRFWQPEEALTYAKKTYEVGVRYLYSSTNYTILGLIAEQVTGQSAADLYRSRYFEPLGLVHTYYATTEAIGGRGYLAAPHDNLSPLNLVFRYTQQPTYPDTITNISRLPFTGVVSAAYMAGGIVSSVDDLLTWGASLYSGQVTSRAVLDTMLQSIPIADSADAVGRRMGYGIISDERINRGNAYFVGHGGTSPGYRALLQYAPAEQLTMAVLANDGGVDAFAVGRRLYEVLYGVPTAAEELRADLGQLTAVPNPATDQLRFSFTLPHRMPVSLVLYDARGAQVRVLYEGETQAAQVQLAVQALPAGIYVSRLQTPEGGLMRRVVVQ